MKRLKLIALAALLPAVLAGCALHLPPLEDNTEIALRGGAVVVPAPEGFCIDNEASNARAGFAMLAPCIAVTGTGEVPNNAAIVTVQVGAAGSATVSGAEDAFVTLLESDAGAGLLGDSAAGRTVTVLSTASTENDVRVAFEETPASIDGTTGTVRRALFDIGENFVTVTAHSIQFRPLSARAGRGLLIDLVGFIKEANRGEVAEVVQKEQKLFPSWQQFGSYVQSNLSPSDGG